MRLANIQQGSKLVYIFIIFNEMNHKYHLNTFLGVLVYRLCRKKG